MPIIKSAKKRVKVAEKANIRNVKTRRTLREALKEFAKAVQSGKAAEITKAERAAMSAIDLAAKKAVIHKNKAARKKAQVSAQAKASGAKPGSEPSRLSAKADTGKATRRSTDGKPTKAPAKKAAAKKPATKTPSKKPVAKKAPAKK